jgi:hypothetical protein
MFDIPRCYGNIAAFRTGHNPSRFLVDFLRMGLSRCQLIATNRERAASFEMNYRLTHSFYLTPERREVLPESSVCGSEAAAPVLGRPRC